LENSEEEREIIQLKNLKKRKREQLKNPLAPNKEELISQIKAINLKLLEKNQISYFCEKCNYRHRKGDIYREHKKHATLRFKFPKIECPTIYWNFFHKIVGIYGLKSASRIKKIEQYASLHLIEDNGGIGVYVKKSIQSSHKTKIGYLYSRCNKYNIVKRALNKGFSINTFFVEYNPKKWRGENWDAEYGVLEIEIFDKREFWKILNGLKELIQLGHRDLKNAFKSLGTRCLKYLRPENDYMREIINFLSQFRKVFKDSESFGIML